MAHYYQFIDTISGPSTVLLDLDNDNPFAVEEGSSVSPPTMRRTTTQGSQLDGDMETASSYESRTIALILNVNPVSAETQAVAIQTLARILDRREGAWLKWQSEGMTEPMFYRTRRASFDTIDDVLDANPLRALRLALSAEPFAYGLSETGSFTITNDPTAGPNKMCYAFPAVMGDVPSPLGLSFPTPDGVHKTFVASQADYLAAALTAPYYKALTASPPGANPGLYDNFNRADNAASMGVAAPGGGTWVAQAGTWGILTNWGYCSAGVASWSTAVIASGLSDVTAEILITAMGANGDSGLVIRSNSSTTGIAFLDNAAWDIATTTQVGAAFTQTFVVGDRMRVVAIGTSIRCFRQVAGAGEWTEVFSVTTNTYQTNQKHGLVIYGTAANTARFDTFRLDTGSIPPAEGWTVTDAADATMVAGNRRRLTKTSGTALGRPTAAVVQQWAGLPPGDYRVMVRTGAAPAGTELLFFNRPPSTGSELIRSEAVGKAVVSATSAGKDWFDLGVVAMPGGAPVEDIAYGQAGATGPALWNVAVWSSVASMTVDLDAVVLIPAGRPGTLTRQGSVAFQSSYTSRAVTWDALNLRRFAAGISTHTPGVSSPLPPSEVTGGNPMVAPGAGNTIHFFTTTADSSSAVRVSDSKAATTVVTWVYFPMYLYQRPYAS